MQTQRKINDEIKMKEWLQCLLKINAGTLELKPKEAWEIPSEFNQPAPDDGETRIERIPQHPDLQDMWQANQDQEGNYGRIQSWRMPT